MPCSSAALMTSSSRIEPPGWITAVAPASIATSSPSAKGKNASEATTDPLVSGSAALARRAIGHRLELHVVNDGIVARLHQQAAGHRFDQPALVARIGQRPGEQQ